MDLILFGAPGAGKGTQGALLAARYGLQRLSTGDLLRDALGRGTPLGFEAKKFMDAGELVPDDVILGLVREVMESSDAAGFIFDGFPRTVAQADGLAALMERLGRSLDAVVVLDVDDETLVQRLAGRLSCPSCQAVYSQFAEPPQVPGKCDACGASLVQREDDRPDTVRRRLAVYREQTAPLIRHYRALPAPVHVIDGARPVDAVQMELRTLLEQ
jgi:adenylate kinase